MVPTRSSSRCFRSSMTICMLPVASITSATSRPDLAQPADVLAECAVERDAEAGQAVPKPPPPPPTPKTAGARARRREAGARSVPAPIGVTGRAKCTTGAVVVRWTAFGLVGCREHDGLARRAGHHQLLHLVVARRVLRAHEIGKVLEREDLAPVLLAQADAAARADAERPGPRRGRTRRRCRRRRSRSAAPDSVRRAPRCREQERKAAPRARAGGGVEDAGGWQHETEAYPGAYGRVLMLSSKRSCCRTLPAQPGPQGARLACG